MYKCKKCGKIKEDVIFEGTICNECIEDIFPNEPRVYPRNISLIINSLSKEFNETGNIHIPPNIGVSEKNVEKIINFIKSKK